MAGNDTSETKEESTVRPSNNETTSVVIINAMSLHTLKKYLHKNSTACTSYKNDLLPFFHKNVNSI